jgi:hypothetical protein
MTVTTKAPSNNQVVEGALRRICEVDKLKRYKTDDRSGCEFTVMEFMYKVLLWCSVKPWVLIKCPRIML